MAEYTNLGAGLWDWPPFVERTHLGRVLFLALYTSAQVKRIVPGLFHGDLGNLAFAAKLSPTDVIDGLRELVDAKLAEWDRVHHVIRLTELPDAWERPTSGRALRGMWTRFGTVPACGVRDAHVALIRWLIDSGPIASDHEKAWEQTFGTVASRTKHRRGVKQVGPKERDTLSQTELFPSEPLQESGKGIGKGIGYPPGADPGTGIGYPDLGEEAGLDDVPLAPVLPLPVKGGRVPLPFTVAQMLEALTETSGGRFVTGVFDPGLAPRITTVIRTGQEHGLTLDDVREVGRWLARGGMSWRAEVLGPSWLAASGQFFEALTQSRSKAAPRGRRPDPSPASSFRGGRREL